MLLNERNVKFALVYPSNPKSFFGNGSAQRYDILETVLTLSATCKYECHANSTFLSMDIMACDGQFPEQTEEDGLTCFR